eukprot:2149660-Pyramimonas_sp.AAC.1
MPLTPKYTWEESEGGIEVEVSIPAVKKTDLDVNYPPYLLHVDLHGEVDDSNSAALVRPDGVTFRLVKVRDMHP